MKHDILDSETMSGTRACYSHQAEWQAFHVHLRSIWPLRNSHLTDILPSAQMQLKGPRMMLKKRGCQEGLGQIASKMQRASRLR